MNIGAYGQKIAPAAGVINRNVKKILIAPVAGAISKNVAAIKVMQSNGSWSKKTHVGRLGDVNGDGIIDISDYTLIRMHYQGISLLTGAALVRADVNRDGVVDEADFVLVRDYILGGGS